MSTQRILQLLASYAIITLIALVSEKSRPLASIFAVFPVNVTIAVWFIVGQANGDASVAADFYRRVLLGLIPAALFVAACWVGFRHGWSIGKVLAQGYVVWGIAMGLYQAVEWWFNRPSQ